ncbi:hypothetical protein [Streptomyces sp. NPDC127098]|uniref:MoaF-related domain-containing protein n=1 Tax=Streptomyces sp. NPDC127098 TaxID=3347137 RepID=UPI00364B1DD5
MAPLAYAQTQVVAQAVEATGGRSSCHRRIVFRGTRLPLRGSSHRRVRKADGGRSGAGYRIFRQPAPGGRRFPHQGERSPMTERLVGRSYTFNLGALKVRFTFDSWTEASGATVTHVEDFANATPYSHVTVDGTLHTFVGTIEEA